jgi:Ras-related protein Rab-5C
MVIDDNIKVVLLDDSSAGKTSIISSYFDVIFSDKHIPTIGPTFQTKEVVIGGIKESLNILDTAEQEAYQSLVPLFYRNSQIAILVFDIIKKKSFEKLIDWIDKLKGSCSDSLILQICGNKTDLKEREISNVKGKNFAYKNNAEYSEVSAKTGEGIVEMFEPTLSRFVKEYPQLNYFDPPMKLPQTKRGCCK